MQLREESTEPPSWRTIRTRLPRSAGHRLPVGSRRVSGVVTGSGRPVTVRVAERHPFPSMSPRSIYTDELCPADRVVGPAQWGQRDLSVGPDPTGRYPWRSHVWGPVCGDGARYGRSARIITKVQLLFSAVSSVRKRFFLQISTREYRLGVTTGRVDRELPDGPTATGCRRPPGLEQRPSGDGSTATPPQSSIGPNRKRAEWCRGVGRRGRGGVHVSEADRE